MKKWLGTWAVVVGLLLLLETASRLVLQRVYNRSFHSSLIIDNKYFNSPGLKANATGTVWGKPFTTDALGGRKNAATTSAKSKWLYIGDSVTEGVGVDDSATFSSLTSEIKADYRCHNISLIGYSLADYANILKYYLPADTAIKRVTLFYCLNDVYGTAQTSHLPVMAKPSLTGKANAFLQQHYATYRLLKLLVFSHRNNYFTYDLQFYQPNTPRFTQAMQYLQTCHLLCKAQGVNMAVVLLPYRSQVNGKNDPLLPQQMVQGFCKSKGIGCHDASAYLKKSKHAQNLYLFADEIHFSETGHRVIKDFLQKEGL